MKKLIFTAIAMVAFSGVSMAGTLKEKENKKDLNEKILGIAPCTTIWNYTMVQMKSRGFSEEIAACVAWAAWKECCAQNTIDLIDNGMPC